MKNVTRVVGRILPVNTVFLLCSSSSFTQVVNGSTAPQRNSAGVSQTPPANLRMVSDEEFQKLLVQNHYVRPNGTVRTFRNLSVSSTEMTLRNQLSQQKQSAETDLLQIRAAHTQKTPVALQPQTGMLNSRMVSATNVRTVATTPSAPSQIGPGTVQSEKTGTSRYATMPNNTQISACPFSNGQIAIGKMTGPGQAMTFTPTP